VKTGTASWLTTMGNISGTVVNHNLYETPFELQKDHFRTGVYDSKDTIQWVKSSGSTKWQRLTKVISSALDAQLASFDYGTNNLVCEDWYGTLVGGGHSQSDCLSFCQKDIKCSHATYYAQSGYCHISSGCQRQSTTSHDSPITYHKKPFAVAEDSGCPTCPPTTTTTTCPPATTTTVTTTTTTTRQILPTSALYEAYSSRMHDTCAGTADKSCHDGTVQQMGSQKGYLLTKPIDGFTEEAFYAYNGRMKDTCTGKASYPCHDGSVQKQGSSIGFMLKNPIEGKTVGLYSAYSSRIQDTCTGLAASKCHDGTDESMGSLQGYILTTEHITLQDIVGSLHADLGAPSISV